MSPCFAVARASRTFCSASFFCSAILLAEALGLLEMFCAFSASRYLLMRCSKSLTSGELFSFCDAVAAVISMRAATRLQQNTLTSGRSLLELRFLNMRHLNRVIWQRLLP